MVPRNWVEVESMDPLLLTFFLKKFYFVVTITKPKTTLLIQFSTNPDRRGTKFNIILSFELRRDGLKS